MLVWFNSIDTLRRDCRVVHAHVASCMGAAAQVAAPGTDSLTVIRGFRLW